MRSLQVLKQNAITVLIVVLVGLSLANAFLLMNASGQLTQKMADAKDQARPAQLEVVRLVSAACGADCYDIGLSPEAL